MNEHGRRPTLTYGWLFYLIFFGFGGFFPLLSVYFREELHLTGTQIGTILSIGPIVMVLAQPVWGIICDATQRSAQVLMLTLTMTGAVGLLFLGVQSYIGLLLLAVLLAIFQSAIVPLSDSMAVSYVQRAGRDYGNLRLWGAIGFASAAYIMGEISEVWGLTVIFVGFAAAMGLSALTAWKLPRERITLRMELRSGLKELWRLPQFRWFLLATFLVFGPVQANNIYFGLLIQDVGGSIAGVGLGFLLAAGSEAPCMKLAGGWIRKKGLLFVTLVAAFISGFRWLFYATEPSVEWVFVSTLLQGLSVGLFIPAGLQYISRIAPEEVKTTAISLYTAVGTGLGNWFFTFVAGMVLDGFRIFGVYLFFGVLTWIGASVILWVMRLDERKKRAVERVV
jgi:MFS transporter, PPP family, 3-phenylpropionic acid transporter